MQWGDGLRVNPGTLRSRSARLLQVRSQLDGQISQHASMDLGPWRGEAQQAQHSAHRQLVSSLESHSRRMQPAADALASAAASFEQIQRSQHVLVQRARHWHYEIDDGGWLRSTATGFARLNPQRPVMRVQLQASALSLVGRLNLTDVVLAGKLRAGDLINDGRDLLASVGNAMADFAAKAADGLLTGVEWAGGKIREGLDWGKGLIADAHEWGKDAVANFGERLGHAGTAAERLLETGANPPKWLKDLVNDGEVPQLAEVLGSAAYFAGQAAGVPLNFIANDDLHFFDDGRPYLADRSEVQLHDNNRNNPYDNVGQIIKPMMDVYHTQDPTDHTDRAQVQVTAVEDPATGEVRYVVSIPGTTEGMDSMQGWAGNPTGTDWAANLKGVGYGDTAATQSIMHSIDLAIAEDQAARGLNGGGRPEVLLTGHSQGGIIAGNIAANPEFSQRYDVGGIISAGSPVDTLAIPENVPVYNYQNMYDPVPRLDFGGLPSGTPSNVTNIVFEHEGSYSPGHTHLQETYENNVDRLLKGEGSPANTALQARMDDELGRFYTGVPTAYRVTYGRETD